MAFSRHKEPRLLIATAEDVANPLAARPRASAEGTLGGFRHESLLYSGADEFLGGTLPAIQQALEAGQPVLVAVARDKIALLRRALGRRAGRVAFADTQAVGRNPARIIGVWGNFLEESVPGGEPALGIGEPVWAGRTDAELAECERHEWLLNLAFGPGQPWRLLCAYDRDGLGEQVLAAARSSHPLSCRGGHSAANGAYREPDWPSLTFAGRLAPPRGAVTELPFSCEHLADVRSMVRRAAIAAALSPDRSEQLVLAASELAANSVQYGGGSGSARIWREDGALLCEVSDQGRLKSALVGRLRPPPDQLRGRGLWLVNQLCDLVQIRSGTRGTAVRVQMDVSSTA
jgi:anti-sigma regulatory factor (Ser/Thr protein kinase)